MTMASTFRDLHRGPMFVLPNPWDIGSARYLQGRGFLAIATTSSGLAAALGLRDQEVTRDQLLTHVEAITGSVSIPLNVDSERCFADDPTGVANTVGLLAAAGAAGCSIEDYDPATGQIDGIDKATERVAAAAAESKRHGLVLTARAENHLYGVTDLDDTIGRLSAYRDAGAEVVYAPGLATIDDIKRVVDEVGVPVNVLATRATPTVSELDAVGVSRVSTGGALAWAAYGALKRAVDELTATGTSTYIADGLAGSDRDPFFGR
ncbi:MAG: isocitrate lyase/phosphoenolpyruvate mutase family protein [Actinomycetia bacterium]|nr:isocitrate lyase/phosphoenolpyruvate mutase family protein [Actinomycetes bacterium]MCP4225916.1 isocitrate lyase/phosphoenolpyruvate mutase family protein [Actinomycetes bacterium]MCP5033763.1 isocitrate lyase/phosphoenolpyruvate mutase family protein [Actinomycetes bacterium]